MYWAFAQREIPKMYPSYGGEVRNLANLRRVELEQVQAIPVVCGNNNQREDRDQGGYEARMPAQQSHSPAMEKERNNNQRRIERYVYAI